MFLLRELKRLKFTIKNYCIFEYPNIYEESMHTLQVPDISHWLETGGSTSFKTLKISMLLWKVLKLKKKKKHPLVKGYLSGKTLTFITVF